MNRLNVVNRLVPLAILSLGLAACGGKDDAASPGGSSPEAAIQDSVALLRASDFAGLITSSVPPAHQEQAKAKWLEALKEDEISDEDRAQFAETMNRLTGPNAEAELMAEIRPQLEQFQGEMRAQLPMFVAMGTGFAVSAINQSEELTAEQKPQVVNLVNAVGKWLETGKFAETDRAERAISEVVATARRLPVRTLDEVQALDFEGSTRLFGIGFDGLKGVLDAYDINLDRALADVRTETLNSSGGNATVRVTTQLFDTPLHFDVPMVEVDGRWYAKSSIDAL